MTHPGNVFSSLEALVAHVGHVEAGHADPYPWSLAAPDPLGVGFSYKNQAFINGKYVPALSGETFSCVSPIHGQVLTEIASCCARDVDVCVRVARQVFERGDWRSMDPKDRKKRLLRFAELMAAHAVELSVLESLDVGKTISNSLGGDIPSAIATMAWYGECCDKLYDEIAPQKSSCLSLIVREPIGVVAAVVPWNFPLLMACWKIAPALAAGNSVILKPAENSSLTALRLGELAAEAGIPDGVFNVIPGLGEAAGQALGRHGDVDMVAFTGSTEVGKLFLRYAGESNMKSVSLECGGKSPNIVCADVYDIDAAASAQAEGIFYNAGQVCSASSRLFVEETIAEAFLDKLLVHTKTWQPGHPFDPKTSMGSLVDCAQVSRVKGYIEAGLREGAELVVGGEEAHGASGGCYLAPTIFKVEDPGITPMREEIFGPVLCMKTFRSQEEALRLANASTYGLQASVWTSDLVRAHRFSRELRAGTVNINATDGGDVTTPFGGYKQSGFGRDKSLHAFEKYTQIKHTCIVL